MNRKSLCDYCEVQDCAFVAICGKLKDTETTISIGKCAHFQGDLIAKAREEERERCARICEELADRLQRMADLSRARRGDLSNSEAEAFGVQSITAAACARRIRGEG